MAFLAQLFFGERSLTKVAGVFGTRESAEEAAAGLCRAARLDASQVRLLAPQDARSSRRHLLGRQVEPESGGIWSGILRAHLVTGVVGCLLGAAVYLAFRQAGNAAVLASPGLSLLVSVAFGTTFGLLVGGLISLRPDQARLIARVRSELAAGRWALVAHPLDGEQTDRIVVWLDGRANTLIRSF